MQKIVLWVSVLLGLTCSASAQTSWRATSFIWSTGCYKAMDLMEILTTEKNRGEDAAAQVAFRKMDERACVMVVYFKEDFDAAPIENGMRRVHGYPYPVEYSLEEIALLFAGHTRPPKQYMYVQPELAK